MPIEDGSTPISISLPDGVFVNDLYDDLKKKVKDKKRLRDIMKQMVLNDISEHHDGTIALKNAQALNINFRNAIIDICNHVYFKKYEQLYEFLRKFGIIF